MFQKAYDRMRAAQAARLQAAGSEGAEIEGSAEAGFTLIELMVVLLIMGILMAIAIPTFLGVTSSAHDKGAQSDLVNALTTAKAYEASNQSYSGFTATIGASSEPSLTWSASNSALTGSNANTVDVYAKAGNSVLLTAASAGDSGCWAVLDTTVAKGTAILGSTAQLSPGPGTWYYGYTYATGSACDPSTILAYATNLTWASRFPGSPTLTAP